MDVAIAGGGPAGLVAGKYLAEKGIKTCLFERKLSVGGGMWGGGMMMPIVVVQEAGKQILDDFSVKMEKYSENYYHSDSIETVTKLVSKSIDAGLQIFNLISIEDVMIRENDKVTGFVINWTATEIASY
ncbi:MAG: sulfide-dependent adenosine diphosphate thiazole synthase [Candidatus Helarchaeota archaeon]